MRVLALDTAIRDRCLALVADQDGQIMGDVVAAPDVESLLDGLVRLLEYGVGAVLVVAGPGSYTGVRAGMAAAIGIATASSLPLYTCGSLEVMVAGWQEQGEVDVLSDAGRGGIYFGTYMKTEGGITEIAAPRRLSEPPLPMTRARIGDIAGAATIDPRAALAQMVAIALRRQPVEPQKARPYAAAS